MSTTLLRQLDEPPVQMAAGDASARGLTLTWDLDRLTVRDGEATDTVAFADLNLQLSRSGRLLRVELRARTGLRVRLCARADPTWLDGLPELRGRDDTPVELDALVTLIDTARAGGASIAHIQVAADTRRVELRRRGLRSARWSWAAAWLGTAALFVWFAAQTPDTGVGAVTLSALWPTVALLHAIEARFESGSKVGEALATVLVIVGLLLLVALGAWSFSSFGHWPAHDHGLGFELVSLLTMSIGQLLPLLATLLSWGWVRRLREYTRATVTPTHLDLNGALLTPSCTVAWRDPAAAAAVLGPAAAPLRRAVDVRTLMALCDDPQALDDLLEPADDARQPDGEVRIVGLLHTGFLGDALRTLGRPARLVLGVQVLIFVVLMMLNGGLFLTLAVAGLVAVARAAFALRPRRCLALDLERAVLVERRGPFLPGHPDAGERVPAATFYAPARGVSWSGVSTRDVRGPSLEARGRNTGLRLVPHKRLWTPIPLDGLWQDRQAPDALRGETDSLCALAAPHADWETMT